MDETMRTSDPAIRAIGECNEHAGQCVGLRVHGVGAKAIRVAITGGCDSVASVGAATAAGMNCGSCKPEIAAILAAMRMTEPV